MAVEQIRILHGGLTWPSVRGARLLQCFTSSEYAAPPSQDPCNDPLPADFPYDLELCVPTAGHVALVLVRRSSATPTARTLTQPLTPSGSSASAPAAPRVVYVLDALPPPRRRSSDDKSKRKKKTPQLPQQPVDELELLHELFEPQSRAAGGKDSSVLVKAPLLCARFDCKVVSIRFLRSGGGLQKSTQKNRVGERVVGAAAPLRCVVAREDGMAYLWEWQADLFQWVFLNRLCFLENPNLKWTRPVAAFTTTDLPLASVNSSSVSDDGGGGIGGSRSSGVTEFAWWSTATKHEPKLKLRRLRFERAADALRATDVVVGSAFSPIPSCDDIVKLLGSKLGLFAVSKVQGIFYRSASASLRTVALDWGSIFALEGDTTGPDLSQILMCVHSVTGELVLLHRKTGEIYLVTPKSPRSSSQNEDTSSDDRDTNGCNTLFARKLTTLSQPSSDAQDEILDMTAHRHVILVLTQHMLRVYTLIGGDLLGTADIPTGVDQGSQNDGPKTCKFWTIPGSANAVGLWAPDGFWTIRLPSAKAVGAALHDSPSPTGADKMKREKGGPEAAFLAVKDYGTGDLHLDAVRYALEVLERVTPSTVDPIQRHPEAWEAVWHTVSSPALLLALLDNRATTEKVVNDLAQYVAAIYAASTGIRSVNRFNGSATTISKTDHLLRLTPANLESLHHLSNWIVLAKRKQRFLLLAKDPQDVQNAGENAQEGESSARDAASTAVYFLLVEYCIKNCDAAELKELLVLKPAYVDMLHVLRALRTSLSSKSKQHERKDDVKDSGVKVGDLRSVLLTLMQQRRAEVVKY
ncbi:hypothetical protein PHYBOEH_007293 [Phytophthora boehmeriae]|uniref:Uncharacterized protein n=1 Tax=Phytophthora boehmeriae TaxID=109152 RepID=A0A8T1XEK2_9STRA|nr:hypothetical protein PHYBOEH_007293 [Phytophthora boehmeriae]